MEVVASAPGKVLITGGYLILERPNAGIVFTTTARFYAIVKPLYDDIKPDSWVWSWTDVKVTSPQLSWEATYKLSLKNSILQCTSSRDSVNPFVEQAVQYAIAASKVILSEKEKDKLQKLLLQGLDITILGSNDFYSYRNQIEAHGLPLTRESLASLPPFSSIAFNRVASNGTLPGEECKPEVAKTGLGSSAAMTTSVVAALLHYLGVVTLPFSSRSQLDDKISDSDLDLVHIVAQSAHCLAQGKIGSGFDVSAAVYGSQRYIRFSPALLMPTQLMGSTSLPDVVKHILEENWDHERFPFCLPPLMTLLLGEPGTGGSSTPSMVGAVKRWQKADPHKSQETWKNIAEANSTLEAQLRQLQQLSETHREAYNHIMGICSHHTYGRWMELVSDQFQESVVKSLLGARHAFLEVRAYMQEMGKVAGVPIEPEPQTQLLDATMNLEGVLLAGVPGAGGYDAVFAIVLGEASNSIADFWSSSRVLPLLVKEDRHGVSLESGDPRAEKVSSGISSMKIV
ncbi:phosphomevalonate kinase, peroxisomal-like [Zingiber officinale]|uniref:phosphomevalonate kinase, peroxisomal-like n=1 Tax=Zingiber officinale TaxID=94328 RepID=UPI001C4C83FE|nr:phosphomevalonate kinase, peroxisomal-like [Zingiber officinale]